MARRNSGVVGTFWIERVVKWIAYIKIKGKKYHLGYFEKLQDAVIARYQAEQKFDRVKKDHLFGAFRWLSEKRLLDNDGNVIE